MLKDINFDRIDRIAVAAVPNSEDDLWSVYLVNMSEEILEMVMVSSWGYGELNGEIKETSVLRWMLGNISAFSYCKIEEIPDEMRALNNEFLISFLFKDKLLDKKVVFVADSIDERFFISVPYLNQSGVVIR